MCIDEAKPVADLDVAHPAGEEEHHLEEEEEQEEEKEDDNLLHLLQCHLPVHIPANFIQPLQNV